MTRFFLSLFLILCTLNPVYADEHWQDPAYIVQSFIEIALKNEYLAEPLKLRRWEQPLRVWIEQKAPDAELDKDLVEMHLRQLSSLTGRTITQINDERTANFRIIFTVESRWSSDVIKYMGIEPMAYLNEIVCIGGFKVNKIGAITKAVVIIPVDQATRHRKLVACIVEELTQVMGLPNDSDLVYPTIFNDHTPDDLLTGLDGLLLKMLYHPAFKVGMGAAEVKPIALKIANNWVKDGTIKRATQTIREGSLYPLMGF